MNDADNFTGLVDKLDHKLSEIRHEIKSARNEISIATNKVDAVRCDQKRMMAQIGEVHQQLSSVHAGQEAIRITLEKNLEQLKVALTASTSVLQAQEAQLATLLGMQKEEAARRQLEQEKGQFLVRTSSLLGIIKDGTVRFLFASRALEISEERDIRSESFMTVTDQKTAADVFRALHDAKEATSDADRAEAKWFLDVSTLLAEISSAGNLYRSTTEKAQNTLASLLAMRQSEGRAVSDLSRPEEVDEARARRLRRSAGILAGIISVIGVIGVGIADPDLASNASPVLLPLFIVSSVIGFVVGWRNSDARRRKSLETHKRKIGDAVVQSEHIDAENNKRDKAAELKLVDFADRLANLNIVVPSYRGNNGNIVRSFSILLEAAEEMKHAWRARHADARLLLG